MTNARKRSAPRWSAPWRGCGRWMREGEEAWLENHPLTGGLPTCGRVDLFAWQAPGVDARANDAPALKPTEPIRTLVGAEAAEIAALWRAQRPDGSNWGADCHFPLFGMRLYPQGSPSIELSFSWRCDNILFLKNGREHHTCGFDTSTPAAQKLRAKFQVLFPEATSRLAEPLHSAEQGR